MADFGEQDAPNSNAAMAGPDDEGVLGTSLTVYTSAMSNFSEPI